MRDLKNKSVMITGGAGFIGSQLAERLVKQCSKVLVYDNFNMFYGGKENNLLQLYEKTNFHLIKGDVLNYKRLSSAMKNIDFVFHLAAQPGVRFSLVHPVETNIVNTVGTLNVVEAARRNGVSRVVNASSSSVYGNQTRLPISESAEKTPISPYGASKLAAENYCRIYHQTYGVDVVSLRYFTVYGPRQRPDMAFYKWTKHIFERKPTTIYGDGNQTRDFTYIDDIVDGTVGACKAEDVDGEIFNIAGGSRISVNEVVGMLIEMSGVDDVQIVHEASKPGDVEDTHADISKASRLFGYHPEVRIKKGLGLFLNWIERMNFRGN
jgi:UDP-glucose 4-epimerase